MLPSFWNLILFVMPLKEILCNSATRAERVILFSFFIAAMMTFVASYDSGAYVAFEELKFAKFWNALLNDEFCETAQAHDNKTPLAADAGVVPVINAEESEPSPDMIGPVQPAEPRAPRKRPRSQ